MLPCCHAQRARQPSSAWHDMSMAAVTGPCPRLASRCASLAGHTHDHTHHPPRPAQAPPPLVQQPSLFSFPSAPPWPAVLPCPESETTSNRRWHDVSVAHRHGGHANAYQLASPAGHYTTPAPARLAHTTTCLSHGCCCGAVSHPPRPGLSQPKKAGPSRPATHKHQPPAAALPPSATASAAAGNQGHGSQGRMQCPASETTGESWHGVSVATVTGPCPCLACRPASLAGHTHDHPHHPPRDHYKHELHYYEPPPPPSLALACRAAMPSERWG